MTGIGKARSLMEVTKPRLSFLALLMTALGFYLGGESTLWQGPWEWLLANTIFGTALLACSSGALNQYMERDIDALMNRTKKRPLPSGRLRPKEVLVFGIFTGILGVFYLLIFVNPSSAVFGAFTLFFYLCIYTRSKQISPLSTLIGAIPGALPPLIGWSASRGSLTPEGLWLFFIVFLWQIPHFLAIGWIYRQEYKNANLPILTVRDPQGGQVVWFALLFTVALLIFSLAPYFTGLLGVRYFAGALLLGVAFLVVVGILFVKKNDVWARGVFHSSLWYLPLLALLMVWDKA